MNKSQIIAAIDKRVSNANNVAYNIWTVGITNDPERRKDEHCRQHDVKHWLDWKADSENIAREIEEYFLGKGMKGGGGGGQSPTYVYIF